MKVFYLLILSIVTIKVSAQDISGIWRGKRTQQTGGCFTEYFQELQITVYQNKILGRSYSYVDENRYTKILFKGDYDPENHKVFISESLILQYNIPEHCVPCIKTYMLNWAGNTNEEILSGTWEGYQSGNQRICPPGKISLKKEATSIFKQETFSKEEFERNFYEPESDKRVIEEVESIIIRVPEIKIELYDNAEVDGDTVSIFLNKNLLLHKKRLSDKPLVLFITAVQGIEYELLMFAENEGSIPPNTSLMLITAGDDKFERRINASGQKSPTLKFRYLKKEEEIP